MINETENQGWIKLHRKILNWEWYDDINATRLFIHLLLTVNYEAKKWHGMTIERGQIVTSIAHLSEETSLTIKQVRLSLEKLKKGEQIVTKGANRFTLITCVKYDDYQTINTERANKGQTEGQTKGKQRATTKEVKEIKEVKNTYIGELPELLSFYNEVFQTNLTSTKGFENNYLYWRDVHDIEKIKTAIENARRDKFWHDKMTLAILFRKKNQRGENVDWIQDLAGRVTQNQGNIAII